jgi:hypothetical protein
METKSKPKIHHEIENLDPKRDMQETRSAQFRVVIS